MTMPKQKPHRSKQDYGTPRAFLDAVERRWGKLEIDLAARADNAKAPLFITPEQDSLATPWRWEHGRYKPLCWLNPPFSNIDQWAAKCATSPDVRIIMLTPASVGTEWYAIHVHGKAQTIFVRPRLIFDGTPPNPKTGKPDPYPKDLMLTLWHFDHPQQWQAFECWKWTDAVLA